MEDLQKDGSSFPAEGGQVAVLATTRIQMTKRAGRENRRKRKTTASPTLTPSTKFDWHMPVDMVHI